MQEFKELYEGNNFDFKENSTELWKPIAEIDTVYARKMCDAYTIERLTYQFIKNNDIEKIKKEVKNIREHENKIKEYLIKIENLIKIEKEYVCYKKLYKIIRNNIKEIERIFKRKSIIRSPYQSSTRYTFWLGQIESYCLSIIRTWMRNVWRKTKKDNVQRMEHDIEMAISYFKKIDNLKLDHQVHHIDFLNYISLKEQGKISQENKFI